MKYTYNSKGQLIDSDAPKKTTEKSNGSSAKSSGKSTSSSNSISTGYGMGTGYSNRETVYRWSDGTITYSNAANYKDAAAAAGKDLSNVSLVGSTTYGTGSLTGDGKNYGTTVVGGGSGKSGFTNKIYSNNNGYSNAYDTALMQAEYLSGLYGHDYTIGASRGNNPYLVGADVPFGRLDAGLSPDVDWERAYNKAAKKQERAIQSRVDAVINTLNSNRDEYEHQFDEIARQAYITNRQAQLALPQQLASAGLTGGASETSLLKLAANYENEINQNETNRLYMNKDVDTQIANAQLSADSDIASMRSEYYLSAMQAYENQINQQNSLYMDMLDYRLQQDKLGQDAYYHDLDYKLALEKMNAYTAADEYDKLEDKAGVLGKYGIFDAYSKLGYTSDEISAMTAAYIAQNTPKTRTVVYKSSSAKNTGKNKNPANAVLPGSRKKIGTDYLRDYVQEKLGISF